MNPASLLLKMLVHADDLVAKASCLFVASGEARKKIVAKKNAQLLDAAQTVMNTSCELNEWFANNKVSESVKKNALDKARVAHEFAKHVREACEGQNTILLVPIINYVSMSLTTSWSDEFSTYHHTELGGFLYLVNGNDENNDTVRALVDRGYSLSNLRENWAGHSSRLAEYFARAPREARATPQAQLARIALAAIEDSGLPTEVINEVLSEANAIIAECEAQNRNEIENYLVTPKKLLNELDGQVASLLATSKPMNKWEAMLRVGELRTSLDNLYAELIKFQTSCNGRDG